MADEDRVRSGPTPGVDPGADTLPSGPSIPRTLSGADRDAGTSGTVPAASPAAAAPEVPDPIPGTRLHHFRVDAVVGRGGMGAVYRAWDESLERPVALKVLLRDAPDLRARFLREARAQAKIRHPNVVPIHFVGEDRGIAFLVMDLIEGESLAAILSREAKLAPDRALEIADAVARALEAGAEQGLVHRDVKPSNVLIDPRGHVLLADFGLAKHVGSSMPPPTPEPTPAADRASLPPGVTREGALVGTPLYMAPEQARGEAVDHRTDCYALGVTLYESIAGQPPFTASSHARIVEQHLSEPPLSPRMLVPALSPAVESLILRMLMKDPAARFPTLAALREAIRAARVPPLEAGSFTARAVAAVVDFLLAAIPGALTALLLNPLALPAAAVFLGLIEGRFGTTLGKRLFRLRTVGPHDTPPGYLRSLLRQLLKLWGPIATDLVQYVLPEGIALTLLRVTLALAWLAGLALALGSRSQSLHDRATHTRVVYSPAPR